MNYKGMDVEVVEQAARDLRAQADQIASHRARCDRLVGRISGTWMGADGSRFTQQTWPTLRTQLTSMTAELNRLSEVLASNVEDQRAASSDASSNSIRDLARSAFGETDLGAARSLAERSRSDAPGVLDYLYDYELGLGWTPRDMVGVIPGVGGLFSLSESIDETIDAWRNGGDGVLEFLNVGLDTAEFVTGPMGPWGYTVKLGLGAWREGIDRAVNDMDWNPRALWDTAVHTVTNPGKSLNYVVDGFLDASADLARIISWW